LTGDVEVECVVVGVGGVGVGGVGVGGGGVEGGGDEGGGGGAEAEGRIAGSGSRNSSRPSTYWAVA